MPHKINYKTAFIELHPPYFHMFSYVFIISSIYLNYYLEFLINSMFLCHMHLLYIPKQADIACLSEFARNLQNFECFLIYKQFCKKKIQKKWFRPSI